MLKPSLMESEESNQKVSILQAVYSLNAQLQDKDDQLQKVQQQLEMAQKDKIENQGNNTSNADISQLLFHLELSRPSFQQS